MSVIITLTTDFGTRDGYAGAVKGVLAARCPGVKLVDITHEIPPHDVEAGAWTLLTAVPWFPERTVHLAVVDPGVGTDRAPIALSMGGHFLVGPDNGLFGLLPRKLGRDWRGVRIDPERVGALPLSGTFHGRDLFAPAAALLAGCLEREGEAALFALGPPIPEWFCLPWPEPACEPDRLKGEVVRIDRFGNAITNLEASMISWPSAVVSVVGRRLPLVRTYGEVGVGESLAAVGSAGLLEIAVNRGSAARGLGLKKGTPVEVFRG